MVVFPVVGPYIPLQEDSDSLASDSGSETDVSDNEHKNNNPSTNHSFSDSDNEVNQEDAQDPFQPSPDYLDNVIDFSFHQNSQELLQENPLPALHGQVQDIVVGGDLAVDTFGTPNHSSGTKPKKKRKPSSKNSRVKSVNPDNFAASRPDSDQHVFAQLQLAKQHQRRSAFPGNMSSPTVEGSPAVVVTATNSDASGAESPPTDDPQQQQCAATNAAALAEESSPNGNDNEQQENGMDLMDIDGMPPADDQVNDPGPSTRSSKKIKSKNASQSTSKVAGTNTGGATIVHHPQSKRSNADNDLEPQPTTKKSRQEVAADRQKKLDKDMEHWYKIDKKANTQTKLATLQKLRRSNTIRGYNIKVLQQGVDDLKAENAILIKRESQLLADLADLRRQAVVTTFKSKAKLLRVCQEQKKKVEEFTRDHLWRICKFISCPDEEEIAAKKVLERLDLVDMKDDDKVWSWVETYKTIIKKALFARRNYVTSELKKLAFKHFCSQGKPLPTVALITKCATRGIDPTVSEELEFFLFYWEEILPKMVGSSNWDKEKKYYVTISKAKTTEPKPKKLITPSSEAMIVAIWDNNYAKWPKLFKWSQQPENKEKILPNWNGKYTITDGGQNEWGGWKPEGLDAFNTYVNQVKAGRKDIVKCNNLEKLALQQLRLRVGIDQPDHDAQKRKNRALSRRKKNSDHPIMAPVHETKVVKTTMDDDDEEED